MTKRKETIARVRLTERQHRAATLAARGRTVEQIAEALGVAPTTAKFHLTRARQLLGVARSRELHDRLEELEQQKAIEVV